MENNSETVIKNIGHPCGQELPYWETVSNCLKGVLPEELQDTLCRLEKGLRRSRAFEKARIKGKYWQVIVDGTQLYSSREKLWGKVRQSREQKHRRLLESWKEERLKECMTDDRFQIRFEW